MRVFLFKYFAPILLATLIVGCSKSEESFDGGEEQSGSVQMNISSRSDVGDLSSEELSALWSSSLLRVSSVSGEGELRKETLIRRYAPATTAPSNLALVNGDYYITLALGAEVSASWSKDDCYYFDEHDFTITSDDNDAIELEATLQNTMVEVVFDETIDSCFEDGYSVTLVVADSYSDEAVVEYEAITLTYTEEENGARAYFLIPESAESSNLSWRFRGNQIDASDVFVREIVLDGVITAPAKSELNRITFNYTHELSYSMTLVVDTETDDKEDYLGFMVRPSITLGGDNSGATSVVDRGDWIEYDVTSVLDITEMTVSHGSTNYTFTDSASSDIYTYELSEDGKSSVLKVRSSAFPSIKGGYNTITVSATSSNQGFSSISTELYCTGLLDADSDLFDSWKMSATLQATITEADVASVEIQYRDKGDDNWTSLSSTTAAGDYTGETIYSATITPTWTVATDSNIPTGLTGYSSLKTRYLPSNGITTGGDYEGRVLIDGEQRGDVQSFSFTGDTPQMKEASFDSSSLTCFTTSGDSSETWASGNNSNTKTLCQSGTINSDRCVVMQAISYVYNLAAGNLFYGQFSYASYTGTVKFGQPFDWGSRPRKFKFDYAAYLGTVDETHDDANLIVSGQKDIGRIYLAIVDWSSRHETKSGLSTKTGGWDPVYGGTDLADGYDVIGYASLFITSDMASTDGPVSTTSSSTPSKLHTTELDIFYFDTDTKPSKDISIVVSCSSCAYGHLMAGSTDSCLWLDDVELVY